MRTIIMAAACLMAALVGSMARQCLANPIPLSSLKIDMKNILNVPVGGTALNLDLRYHSWYEGTTQVEVPREWSDGAKCAALRVSHVLVDNKKKIILGAMGSNVYPTTDEGAFALTNQIFAAVWERSGGKAMAVPLHADKKKGCYEATYWWKPDPAKAAERELVVRTYVNQRRQMAVCCLLHTKGGDISADYASPPKGQ